MASSSNSFISSEYPILDDTSEEKLAAQQDSEQMFWSAVNNRVQSIHLDNCKPGEDESFFVADLGEVYRRDVNWKKHLGSIAAFYG